MSTPLQPRRGFTLIEIMIVTVIIGILAAIAIPLFARLRKESQATQFVNDLRVLRDAVEMYVMKEGQYPEDHNSGRIHKDDNLEKYVSLELFEAPTCIGGQWDVEFQDSGITSGVGVVDYSVTEDVLVMADQKFDDGNTATGRLRKITPTRFYWVFAD